MGLLLLLRHRHRLRNGLLGLPGSTFSRNMSLVCFGKSLEVLDSYDVGQAFVHREYGLVLLVLLVLLASIVLVKEE